MTIGGRRALVGRAADYQDPVSAITYQLAMLLRDYAAKNGDLECVQLTVGTAPLTPGRVSRTAVYVQLDGYETSR